MCGITGVVEPGATPERELVERMSATLAHRGPDDAGIHLGPDIGLGFRRLAIIDLETGNQPMQNEDGTVVSVFNGEIYNFRELRKRLLALGHRLHSQGDAEVLPHLYEEYGPGLVDHLQGMFAIAIWDAPRKRLVLACDPIGEKPLYYAPRWRGTGLAFASEAKALLAAGVSREPDLGALAAYLYHLYVPAPRSAFQAVAKLPPGHLLCHEGGSARVRQYWKPQVQVAARSEAEHVAGLRERVIQAVAARLEADVPLGAFLSGGIDSACIVAAMHAAGADPIHTFTISFPGHPSYDEAAAARVTAEHYGTDHHELSAELDVATALPAVIEAFDEPFGNPTAVLVHSLSRAARPHVKVALDGDGGDELLFGYPRFRGLRAAVRYQRLVPDLLRMGAARASAAIPESTAGRHAARRLREFLAAGNLDSMSAYRSWIGYFSREMRDELLADGLADESAGAEALLTGLFTGVEDLDLNQLSVVELQSFLPYNVLAYADRMSMACGLELRAPFVDRGLVEYALTLPTELKLRGATSKWALRRAFAAELPPHVMRMRKRGLNPPVGAWLAGPAAPLVAELLSEQAVRRRGLFTPSAVTKLLREQEHGKRDRALHIWSLLALEMWFRVRVDG
jgi:asparagine synthase (glutamine-hydrolysing)